MNYRIFIRGWLVLGMFSLVANASGLTLEQALDDPNLTWTTAPNTSTTRPWIPTNNVPFDGVDEAISGNRFQANTDSWIETTVVGPGTISFYWRVSCEPPDYLEEFEEWLYYDYLEFKMAPGTPNWSLIDPSDRIAGLAVNWSQRTFAVPPGPHTLRWNYHKDGSENGGVDQGRLDQVVYTPSHSNRPPVVSGQSLTNLAETAIPIVLEASDPDGDALSFSIGNGPVHGVLDGDGSNWVYTSAANYYGPDSFNFTATDGEAISEIGTVDLMILPLNRAVVISGISPAGESVSLTGLVQPNRQVVLEASESLFPPVWTGVDTQNIAWSTNFSVSYEISVPRTNDSQFFRLKSLVP